MASGELGRWSRTAPGREFRLLHAVERPGSGARDGRVDNALLEQVGKASMEWKEEVERHRREGGSWR